MIETSARALLDAVMGLAAELELPGVLRRVVESACTLTGAGHGVFAVLGAEQGFDEVVQHGGAAEYRTIADLPDGPGTLSLPVDVDGKVYGRLCLSGKPGGAFGERDQESVATLTTAAGIAIGNATRYEQALQRERWRAASQQVTAALLTGEDSGTTLHTIAERARAVANASGAAVAMPSEQDPSILVFEVVASPEPQYQRLVGATVPVEGTASGVAFASGQPVVVREYGRYVLRQQEETIRQMPVNVDALDSAVAVPMIVGAQTLGVLLVTKFRDKVPFSDTEVELVQDFAGHAALAVEFARAEADRRRLAVFEDRDRIARDLHDLVIQRLFAVGLGLESLRKLTQPEVAEQVAGFVRELDRTIRDVRNSIFSLQEPAEAHAGVRSDLLRMAQDSSGMLGFEPRISFDGPLDAAITGPARSDLLATIREALSNVARHAGAHAVSVEVVVDSAGQRLTARVTDDGRGPAPNTERLSGLTNLQRRAARWNGTLSVGPGENGGTELEWTAVLPRRQEGAR
ncbi:GAF domain-containing protein [Amycolatopsis sp.]|uniref:sensor histidine kinase n=1 Tax=Amycolatopsis sp. TaxID=37632 RepID=UPI002BF408A0|nr:GAF domain-containing protein [Amycolatopsis sp.]HVV14733.1 GAF domain-containing protein [Amycolatopsis sp.]